MRIERAGFAILKPEDTGDKRLTLILADQETGIQVQVPFDEEGFKRFVDELKTAADAPKSDIVIPSVELQKPSQK